MVGSQTSAVTILSNRQQKVHETHAKPVVST
jgi:hypothetical protein